MEFLSISCLQMREGNRNANEQLIHNVVSTSVVLKITWRALLTLQIDGPNAQFLIEIWGAFPHFENQ